MTYTNIILKNLEKELENAEFEVEEDKEENYTSNINSRRFFMFFEECREFYNNYKKGYVDAVEFDDGMITIKKFLNMFPNQEITFSEKYANYVKELLEASEDASDDSEVEEIADDSAKLTEDLKKISELADKISISFDKTEVIFIFEKQNIDFQKIESMFNEISITHYFEYDDGKYYYCIDTNECPDEIIGVIE